MLLSCPIFESIYLASPKVLKEIQNPQLKSSFMVSSKDTLCMLTANTVFLYENFHSKHIASFCSLTFQVKFQVLRDAWIDERTPGKSIGIRLEKEIEGKIVLIDFYSSSPSILDMWEKELEKKINQRNFHKLFKAKKKIGKGAFATVYLTERLSDNKLFAVKAFSKQKQYSGEKGKQSLQNEIKIMRATNHPNTMKLESVFETDNSIYFILEYFEGIQLNQYIKSGKHFDPEEIKHILKNILSGLSHFNQKNIIHRDLKPENIMFRKQNSTDLAICDYGLATFADQQKYLFVRCGTPGFVAPEIINIKDMSTKSQTISDVFSAGIIFHYLLFNSSIFSGKKYNEILAQNRSCDYEFTDQKYQKIQKSTLQLLMKMLQKNASKRISAESALRHSYFSNQMDVEMPKEVNEKIFKERQNFYAKIVQKEDTLSQFSGKYDKRASLSGSVNYSNNENIFK